MSHYLSSSRPKKTLAPPPGMLRSGQPLKRNPLPEPKKPVLQPLKPQLHIPNPLVGAIGRKPLQQQRRGSHCLSVETSHKAQSQRALEVLRWLPSTQHVVALPQLLLIELNFCAHLASSVSTTTPAVLPGTSPVQFVRSLSAHTRAFQFAYELPTIMHA